MDQSKDTYDVAAARILMRLAEEDGIEFVSSYGVASLTNPLSAFLLNLESDGRAAALAEFLVEKDEVADLFASDEVLEEVLKQEWDGLANRGAAEKADKKATKPKKSVFGARNEELEARLALEPDNVELYLVYGDWLQEQGDPLGELVARQAAVAFVPDEQDHRKAAMQYLREHESYLVGGLARYRQAVRIDWHMGFIWSAKLWTEVITEEELQGRVLLDWLLGLPTARFLRELWLGPLDHEGLEQYRAMLEVLLATSRPALRSLHVGVVDGSLVPGSGTDGGDLRPVGRMLPELRQLEVRVGHAQLTGLELPKLEGLALELDSATKETLEALGESGLPELARLELSLSGYRLETRDLVKLVPLFDASRIPKLRQLSLRVNETGDALVELLASSAVLAQLEQLDLSSCGLTDEGAQVIVKNAERYSGLARLDVSRNWLSDDAVDRLTTISGPEIAAGDQEEPDEGFDDDLSEDVSDDGEHYDEIME
jgi:uncharacterized protein (TIGR02996 family)